MTKSTRVTDAGVEQTYHASSNGVIAWVTLVPASEHGYKMYTANVRFLSPRPYGGEVEISRPVGTQGSMRNLCEILREASAGICKLLDPYPRKPEVLARGVAECIAKLEKETTDLYNEPPF